MKSKRDFDRDALEWDSFAPRVKLITEIGDSLLKRVELSPEMDVLDFGCGTGLLSLRMASEIRALTGADTSKGMLEVMAGKADDRNLSNVRPLLLDPESDAPFEGSYDLIVSSMVMHHIDDVGALLARLHAALRPGGLVCIADLDPDGGLFHDESDEVFHNGFERAAFAEILQQVGFSSVELTDAASIIKPVGEQMQEFSIFLACGRKI